MEALTDGWIDRWTYTQNFRGYNIFPSPLFVAGHKKFELTINWAAEWFHATVSDHVTFEMLTPPETFTTYNAQPFAGSCVLGHVTSQFTCC